MVEYQIEVDPEGTRMFRDWEQKLPKLRELILKRLSTKMMAQAHTDLQRGRWGITSGANGRSGRLAGSIWSKIVGGGDELDIGAGSGVVYARIQELGGTIKAKNAPYLKFNIGGRWVQTKEVYIPGKYYLRSTINDFFRTGTDRSVSSGAFEEHKRRHGFT